MTFSVPSYLVDEACIDVAPLSRHPYSTLSSQDWHGSRASGWAAWNKIAGLVVTVPEEDARAHICI